MELVWEVQSNCRLIMQDRKDDDDKRFWIMTKAENYMPRFPIPSGAPCALASFFTSVQYCLEMLVHYLVTLSHKPVQYRLHSWIFFKYLRLIMDDFTAYPLVTVFTTTCDSLSESKPEPHHATRHIILSLVDHQWPLKSCDLTLLIFPWGTLKSLIYVTKPHDIGDLKEEIRRVVRQS